MDDIGSVTEDINETQTPAPDDRHRCYPRVRARPVRPGDHVKLTRRVVERRFFLRPCPELVELIGYWLAVCVEAHGIELHAATFMSNHYHLDVTDRLGNLPAFKNHFNGVLARAINAHLGRFDTFWSADGPCDTRMLTDDDVLSGMTYTLTNPVKAGLVRRARRWPGFHTANMKFGETRTFARPARFFDAHNGDLPDTATLAITRPNIRPDLSDNDLFDALQQCIHEKEQKIARDLLSQNRRFLGESRIRRQRWTETPTSRDRRFRTTPTFMSQSKWARIAQVQRNRAWEEEYARAREAWLSGQRDVAFPEGTYWMRRFAGVPVVALPEPP